MKISRRRFLTVAGMTAASAVLAPTLKNLAEKGEHVQSSGFGEIIPDPKGILDLPAGFQYKIVSRSGNKMSDRTFVPTNFDGMGVFKGANNTTILIRNHELSPDQTPAVTAPDDKKYNKASNGGTTTIVLDENLLVIDEFVSLAGTNRNCAGGPTPWGTWISSEEDTSPGHGYNFEVPTTAGIVTPAPLIDMGRFRHEAVAVDPSTGYIYQTEDQIDGCFYRFRPKENGNLIAGGTLEALVIDKMRYVDTSLNFPLSQPQKVSWIAVKEVNPKEDNIRYQSRAKGAATFRRGEGICWADGQLYFTCTNGGKAEVGQIFRYNPTKETIELFFESTSKEVLDYPDNLILAPFGDLIVCEDGKGEQLLVGITSEGKYYHFARNALNNAEFAGVGFSPDGGTMFVNIYSPGLTLAVQGNWRKPVNKNSMLAR
ncbi:MAG: DUF839 domain-containing protein [Chlorogloea purpurea SAG 13.99]|nr:DUF839 domain-containing protein [Chlorogloea purpurea SAG 13.99]